MRGDSAVIPLAAGADRLGGGGVARSISGGVMIGPRANTAARSRTFRSSRTFPGQSLEMSISILGLLLTRSRNLP